MISKQSWVLLICFLAFVVIIILTTVAANYGLQSDGIWLSKERVPMTYKDKLEWYESHKAMEEYKDRQK